MISYWPIYSPKSAVLAETECPEPLHLTDDLYM